MLRFVVLLALACSLLASPVLKAEVGDDGPPISITSPDADQTFALGTIKTRSLYWDAKAKTLMVRVTFIDAQANNGQSNEDTHVYRLPGVSYDAEKKVFTATTKKGDVIPIAQYKQVLFIKTVQTTPNAAVRVIHSREGIVTVILEAISPNDPAMHPAPTNPDGEHKVDVNGVLR